MKRASILAKREHWFYIDGKFFTPENRKTFPVVNPATEEVLYDLPLGTSADVDAAVKAAQQAFVAFSRTTPKERQALLERIVDCYDKKRDILGQLISQEMGDLLVHAIRAQAGSGRCHLETFIGEMDTYPFQEELGKCAILKEPIGVCALITPWNWPMNQIALKVGAAIAAGCTMVLKPSEYTPSCAVVFAEIMHEAGVPPGFEALFVFGDVAGDSAHKRGVQSRARNRTRGSTRAGIDVARCAAPTVKRVSQELGGKSPNIILDDTRFEKSITDSVVDCFGNCGQSCNAPTRMLVPATRMAEAAEIAASAAAKVENGPCVNKIQWDRIQGLIQKGIEEGATLNTGGPGRTEGKERGYYVKPTIFSNCNNNMTICREEIFGPVMCILGYTGLDEAVQIANDTPYGLAAYINGSDMEIVRKLVPLLRAGNVSVNGCYDENRAPFGGYKQSGNGRESGRFGIDEFVEVKAVFGAGGKL